MEPVIIDAIVVAVLVAFAVIGARRGLFQTLAGLLALIVALVGAGLFAKTLAQPMADLLAPLIEQHIEIRVDDAIHLQGGQSDVQNEPDSELELRVESLLELMGMDPQSVDTLAQKAVQKIRDTGASLAAAVVESVSYSILYGVLFILSFLALLLAIRLVSKAFDLVLKLPVLHGLNALGGAGIGLLEGSLLLFLVIWAARRFGISFETEQVAATYVLRFFTTNTPLSVLSFLL